VTAEHKPGASGMTPGHGPHLISLPSSRHHPKLTTSLYLAMGWLVLIAVKPLWLRMPSEGLLWLLAGGIAYTVGVVFYAAKRVRYSHFIWHLFVITGTSCHYVAVLRFAS
jgi:hemolysin III